MNNADKLLNYKKLLDDGVITQEEFETKKKECLSAQSESKNKINTKNGIITPKIEKIKTKFNNMSVKKKSIIIVSLVALLAFIYMPRTLEPVRKTSAELLKEINLEIDTSLDELYSNMNSYEQEYVLRAEKMIQQLQISEINNILKIETDEPITHEKYKSVSDILDQSIKAFDTEVEKEFSLANAPAFVRENVKGLFENNKKRFLKTTNDIKEIIKVYADIGGSLGERNKYLIQQLMDMQKYDVIHLLGESGRVKRYLNQKYVAKQLTIPDLQW